MLEAAGHTTGNHCGPGAPIPESHAENAPSPVGRGATKAAAATSANPARGTEVDECPASRAITRETSDDGNGSRPRDSGRYGTLA